MSDHSAVEAQVKAPKEACSLKHSIPIVEEANGATGEEDSTSDDTLSPAEKVFGIYELGEKILLHLDTGTLARAQRICRRTHAIIQTSKPLHQDLFAFRPVRGTVYGLTPARFLQGKPSVDFLSPYLTNKPSCYLVCRYFDRTATQLQLEYTLVTQKVYMSNSAFRFRNDAGRTLIYGTSMKKDDAFWRKVCWLKPGSMARVKDGLHPQNLEEWDKTTEKQEKAGGDGGIKVSLHKYSEQLLGERMLGGEAMFGEVYDALCQMARENTVSASRAKTFMPLRKKR